MSRIGRKVIVVPAGVTVTLNGQTVEVKGPKGTLTQTIDKVIKLNFQGNEITLTRENEDNETKAKHGLYRALIANMVKGASEEFTKTVTIKGVGYKASKQGKKLVLNLGYSHPVEITEEDGIRFEIVNEKDIKVVGPDKQKVGQFASKIRDFRKVEPYHGYGVRYIDEVVIKKVGKTAAKGKK